MRPRALHAIAIGSCLVLLFSKVLFAQVQPGGVPPDGRTGGRESASPLGGATPENSDATADPKEEARIRFERGKALLRENALSPALAEFLESRRIYPTWSATSSAAFCLQQLQRFDEALTLFEVLLKDFGTTMPSAAAGAALRAVAELRERVGTIEVTGAEVGAAISIDGQSRGDYPALAPLRVAAGSHVVRVYKEGFEPFETRIDVAGGETARVAARLRAFAQAGRLRVVEQSGRALDVLVDGGVVGETPWEGRLAIGDHVIVLRGENNLGTQPVSAPVRLNELTNLTLAAEPLEASLRIVPTPPGAAVSLDAVTVGRGLWQGRVRAGRHTVTITADAFLPARRQLNLERGQREVVEIALEPDPRSPHFRRPSRFFVEAGGAVSLVPVLSGEIGSSCGRGCTTQAGLGLGGYGVFHGGYALGWGLSFGVAAGYLHVVQEVTQERAAIGIVADDADARGTVEDTLTVQGFLSGAWSGFSFGDRFPIHLRLGAGAVLASLVDSKTGRITAPEELQLGRRGITRTLGFLWVSPAARVGLRLGDRVEVTAGVEALLLFAPSPPRWERDGEENVYLNAGRRGAAQFPPEAILSPTALLLAPGISVRYAF